MRITWGAWCWFTESTWDCESYIVTNTQVIEAQKYPGATTGALTLAIHLQAWFRRQDSLRSGFSSPGCPQNNFNTPSNEAMCIFWIFADLQNGSQSQVGTHLVPGWFSLTVDIFFNIFPEKESNHCSDLSFSEILIIYPPGLIFSSIN